MQFRGEGKLWQWPAPKPEYAALPGRPFRQPECQPRTKPQSPGLGTSCATQELYEHLHMVRLRENIKEMNVTDDVAAGFFGRADQQSEIASDGSGVTREIGNGRRSQIGQPRKRRGSDAGPRWIEHDQIGFLAPAGEEGLRVHLAECRRTRAAFLQVRREVARRCLVRFHANDAFELMRQWQGEQANSGEQIQCET